MRENEMGKDTESLFRHMLDRVATAFERIADAHERLAKCSEEGQKIARQMAADQKVVMDKLAEEGV